MPLLARTTLCRATLRSASRDGARARQRFERALAQVDWSPPELAPAAILVVRRLAVGTGPATPPGLPFPQRVSAELRACVRVARRPWLHEDAALAPAVIFADEAELIACLARDWLHGLLALRWWWPGVLRDASAEAWLRREVLPRGEVLVPAMGMLAACGQAAAFVARLGPAECVEAAAALARSHGLRLPASLPERTPASGQSAPAAERAIASVSSPPERDSAHQALARLVREVPELGTPRLVVPQQRLLAVALALTRTPNWLRTSSFAVALELLGGAEPAQAELLREFAQAGALPGFQSAPARKAGERAGPTRTPNPLPRRSQDGLQAGLAACEVDDLPEVPVARPMAAQEQARTRPAVAAPHGRAELPSTDPVPPGPATAPAPEPLHLADAPDPPRLLTVTPPARTRTRNGRAPTVPSRVSTGFGGLFYLLNAALALGLYGDFTRPLSRAIGLSPWDWLALVGRAWFGDELVEDAVWFLLAGLAGRGEDEEPGRDLEPPSPRWFEEQLAELEARIARAVGQPEGEGLRALVCRHHAGIETTAATVHIFLALDELPLAIRIAGLDRDPGWIPSAGRDIRFFFA